LQSELAKSHDCQTAGPLIRSQLGCDEPLLKELSFSVDGIFIDRCPAFYLKNSNFAYEALEMHGWREKGILPFPGGYLDQPNKYVETMNYLDYLFSLKLERFK